MHPNIEQLKQMMTSNPDTVSNTFAMFHTMLYVLKQTENPLDGYKVAMGVAYTFKQLLQRSCELKGIEMPVLDFERAFPPLPDDIIAIMLSMREMSPEFLDTSIHELMKRISGGAEA